MTPEAGTLKAKGILYSISGLPIVHSSPQLSAGGASFGSPSGAPASTQATRMFKSAEERRRSFKKEPTAGSANQGGIFRDNTTALIALAHGLVAW